MTFSIVLGIIILIGAVVFLVLGIKTLVQKEEDTFMGLWSMYSETEKAEYRAKYNMEKMRVFNGWFYLGSAVAMALLGVSHFFEMGRFREVMPFIVMIYGFAGSMYSTKSKRLRNTIEENKND